jgi:hypothetical protein
MRSKLLVPSATIALGCGCAVAQSIVISDATFNQANWEHAVAMSEGDVEFGPFSQELAGGNPGAFQQGHHTTDGPFASLYGTHLYLPYVYSPGTQGEIESIDISYDWRDLGEGGVQQGLVVQQGTDAFIRLVGVDDPHPLWTTLSLAGITADDPAWKRITAGGMFNQGPDFSEAGADLRIGYYTFNWSLPKGLFVERTWGIDNFKVTIHSLGCEADCNGDGQLNIVDFVCFQIAWKAHDPIADCNGDGEFNVVDFVCYQGLFLAGCGG